MKSLFHSMLPTDPDDDTCLTGYRADIIYSNVNFIEPCDLCTLRTGNGTVILTIYDWGETGSLSPDIIQPDEIGFAVLDNKQNLLQSTNIFDYNGIPDKIVLQDLDAGMPTPPTRKTNQLNFTHWLKLHQLRFTRIRSATKSFLNLLLAKMPFFPASENALPLGFVFILNLSYLIC